MSRPRHGPRSLSRATRILLRAVLYLHPSPWRREFGEQWLAFLELQRGEDRYASRVTGALRYGKDVAVDGVGSAWRARFESAAGRAAPGGELHQGWRARCAGLRHDVSYGARLLTKHRGFAAVAIFSLALGSGVNTAVFGVVDAMLLRPLPYRDADRLVVINRVRSTVPGGVFGPQFGEYRSWRSETDGVFVAMAAHNGGGSSVVSHAGGEPERLRSGYVSSGLFPMLGVDPLLGRHFLPEEEVPGAEEVVIISHGLWQRQFGGDAEVLGSALVINGTPAEVVGVMPRDFDFLYHGATQLWQPLRVAPADERRGVLVAARLAPDVPLDGAQAAADALAARAESFPAADGWGLHVVPLDRTRYYAGNLGGTLVVLWGAGAFVLLIACANVAGMLLARASARRREIATRLALGSSRSRIVTLFVAEGLLLGLAGGVAGALLAHWVVRGIILFSPDSTEAGSAAVFPRLPEAGIDARVLGYTLLVSVVTSLLFSIVPALRGARPGRYGAFTNLGRGAAGRWGGQRLRNLLVVGQVALSVVLLTGAGLMLATMRNLWRVDPGFDAPGLVMFTVEPERDRFWAEPGRPGEPPTMLTRRIDELYERILAGVRGVPGVEAASATGVPPLSHFSYGRRIVLADRPPPAGARPWHDTVGHIAVMDGYFEIMGIPIRRGRGVTRGDSAGTPWVAVINESMAEELWPGQDPLGKRLTIVGTILDEATPGERSREVVGVVGDVHHWTLQAKPSPQMYVPAVQQPLAAPPPRVRPDGTILGGFRGRQLRMSFVMRTDLDRSEVISFVRGVVASIDPDLPATNFRSGEDLFARSIAGPRFYAFLTVIFATVALVLSQIGLYGVMAFSVAQRTHEIGVRMSLGAQQAYLLKWVLGRGLVLGGAGVAIGLLGSLWLTRLLAALHVDFFASESPLFGVGTRDPVTLLAVSLLLVGSVLAASYQPARAATAVDPVVALRSE